MQNKINIHVNMSISNKQDFTYQLLEDCISPKFPAIVLKKDQRQA